MALNDLKKELVSYIESSTDEEVLSLLKEDLIFYGKIKDEVVYSDMNCCV